MPTITQSKVKVKKSEMFETHCLYFLDILLIDRKEEFVYLSIIKFKIDRVLV